MTYKLKLDGKSKFIFHLIHFVHEWNMTKTGECSFSLFSSLSSASSRTAIWCPIQLHFCCPDPPAHLAYLDRASSPSKHLHFACNCQQKGLLVVTHEGTSHPSQRTRKRWTICYSCQCSGKDFCLSFSKIMCGTVRRTWKKAERLKLKNWGKHHKYHFFCWRVFTT